MGIVVATLPVEQAEQPARRPPARSWIGEFLAVVVGSVAVTCWAFRDMLSGLSTTVPGEPGDPSYFAWQLAWVRHALLTDPGGLWTTPAFLRAPDNLAFTDTVLGYTPLGLFVPEGMAGGLTLLNLATVAAGAVAVVGAYALARAMGAGRLAALVAGAGFGFAPWRLQQIIHVNVLSTGGIALALALLARGTGWSLRRGWEPERMSWRWITAGWVVACYQLTFGFALGIWFVHTLGVVMVLWCAGWLLSGRRTAWPARSAVIAHAGGGALFGLTLLLLLPPYLRVQAAHPEARRGEDRLPLFSPPWRGLLTAPDTSWFWGDRQTTWRAALRWPQEMALSPGVVLLALAVTGVFCSVWPWRRRLALVLATAALTVLAMGTAFPLGHGEWTYLPLYRHVPGWSALRTSGRLMVWITLGLCLLAAGAVARLSERLGPERLSPEPLGLERRGRGRATASVDGVRGVRALGAVAAVLVAVVPVVLVVGEGLNRTPHPTLARAPVDLRTLAPPILILPSDDLGDYTLMLWGADGWPVLANGNSGFEPVRQRALRVKAASFPDAASIAALRARGIMTVLLVPSRLDARSPWAGAAGKPIDGLGITRTVLPDAVVYRLSP